MLATVPPLSSESALPYRLISLLLDYARQVQDEVSCVSDEFEVELDELHQRLRRIQIVREALSQQLHEKRRRDLALLGHGNRGPADRESQEARSAGRAMVQGSSRTRLWYCAEAPLGQQPKRPQPIATHHDLQHPPALCVAATSSARLLARIYDTLAGVRARSVLTLQHSPDHQEHRSPSVSSQPCYVISPIGRPTSLPSAAAHVLARNVGVLLRRTAARKQRAPPVDDIGAPATTAETDGKKRHRVEVEGEASASSTRQVASGDATWSLYSFIRESQRVARAALYSCRAVGIHTAAFAAPLVSMRLAAEGPLTAATALAAVPPRTKSICFVPPAVCKYAELNVHVEALFLANFTVIDTKAHLLREVEAIRESLGQRYSRVTRITGLSVQRTRIPSHGGAGRQASRFSSSISPWIRVMGCNDGVVRLCFRNALVLDFTAKPQGGQWVLLRMQWLLHVDDKHGKPMMAPSPAPSVDETAVVHQAPHERQLSTGPSSINKSSTVPPQPSTSEAVVALQRLLCAEEGAEALLVCISSPPSAPQPLSQKLESTDDGPPSQQLDSNAPQCGRVSSAIPVLVPHTDAMHRYLSTSLQQGLESACVAALRLLNTVVLDVVADQARALVQKYFGNGVVAGAGGAVATVDVQSGQYVTLAVQLPGVPPASGGTATARGKKLTLRFALDSDTIIADVVWGTGPADQRKDDLYELAAVSARDDDSERESPEFHCPRVTIVDVELLLWRFWPLLWI